MGLHGLSQGELYLYLFYIFDDVSYKKTQEISQSYKYQGRVIKIVDTKTLIIPTLQHLAR
jgi:hypothetical protein